MKAEYGSGKMTKEDVARKTTKEDDARKMTKEDDARKMTKEDGAGKMLRKMALESKSKNIRSLKRQCHKIFWNFFFH